MAKDKDKVKLKRTKPVDDVIDNILGSKPKKVKTKKLLKNVQTLKEFRQGLEPGELPVAKPIGRPTDLYYMSVSGEDRVLSQKIYILAAKGTPYKKIRKELNITLTAWDKMMRKDSDKYPVYKKALDRGNKYAIEEVEDALRCSAMGYDYEETTEGVDGDRYIKKTTVKHVKADVKAIQFYLINKAPEKYKMKQPEEITITHKKESVDPRLLPPDMLKIIMAAKTTEEIAAAMKTIEPVVTVNHEDV